MAGTTRKTKSGTASETRQEPDPDETPQPEEKPGAGETPPSEEPDADESAEPQVEPGQGDEKPITQTPPEVTPTLDAPVSDSAPLAAPVNSRPSKAPHPGDTAAAPQAVARTAPGPHLRLVDDDGHEIDPDDVFLPQRGPSTLLTVATRVWQEYRYPGTDEVMRQLLYNGHVEVPIRVAMQTIGDIKAVMREGAEKSAPEQVAI